MSSSQTYSVPIISCKTGNILESNIDLSSHLCSCLTSPVEWVSTVNTMFDVLKSNSMIIEVGPKRVLNNLISSIKEDTNINQNNHVKYLNNVEGKIGSFTDLNWVIATIYANGIDVNLSQLHINRIVDPWIPPSKKSFIVNPCGRLNFRDNGFEYLSIDCFAENDQQNKIDLTDIGVAVDINNVQEQNDVKLSEDVSIENILIDLCVEHTGFQRDHITNDMHMVSDLNLDSIKVRSVVSKATNLIGLESGLTNEDQQRLNDASIAEIAQVLQNIDSYLYVFQSEPPFKQQQRNETPRQ